MKRNLILCVIIVGALLISAVGCQREPAVSTGDISSIDNGFIDSIPEESMAAPEDTESEAVSVSVAENTSSVASMPKTSSQPASAVESQKPPQAEPSEVSSAVNTVEEWFDSKEFNSVRLLFKPEYITSKEEMTQASFYPGIDSEYIEGIEWNPNPTDRFNYNVIIQFKQYSMTEEIRQQVREALKSRTDLLKIDYTVWFLIGDGDTKGN